MEQYPIERLDFFLTEIKSFRVSWSVRANNEIISILLGDRRDEIGFVTTFYEPEMHPKYRTKQQHVRFNIQTNFKDT